MTRDVSFSNMEPKLEEEEESITSKDDQSKKKKPGASNQSAVDFDTNTFHMYAVISTAPDSERSSAWTWILSSASLLVVLIQLTILVVVIDESRYKPCKFNDDCPGLEFCSASSKFHRPRCLDCAALNIKKFDGVCKPKKFPDAFIAPNKVWSGEDFTCEDWEYCAAQKNEDWDMELCPDVSKNFGTFSTEEQFVLFVSVVLFVIFLIGDMEESEKERSLLDHMANTVPPLHPSTVLIRTALRLRRFLLPWLTAGAAAAIIISDDLSCSNILLNILAVQFIADADNMLSAFLFTPDQLACADDFVEEMKENAHINVPFWEIRITGLCAGATMLIILKNFEFFAQSFVYIDDNRCARIARTLRLYFTSLLPITVLLVHSVGVGLKRKTYSDMVLKGVLDFIRGSLGYILSNFLILFVDMIKIAEVNYFSLKLHSVVLVMCAIAEKRAIYFIRQSSADTLSPVEHFLDIVVVFVAFVLIVFENSLEFSFVLGSDLAFKLTGKHNVLV